MKRAIESGSAGSDSSAAARPLGCGRGMYFELADYPLPSGALPKARRDARNRVGSTIYRVWTSSAPYVLGSDVKMVRRARRMDDRS